MVFQIAMSLIKTLFQLAKLSIITQKAVSNKVFVPFFYPFFGLRATYRKISHHFLNLSALSSPNLATLL